MRYNSIKPFRPTRDVMVPTKGYKGKNYSFFFLPENHDFLDSFRIMGIEPKNVKYVLIPQTKTPIATHITGSYRKELMDNKLIAKTGILGGDYSEFYGNNFYFDASNFINTVIDRKHYKTFRSGPGNRFITDIVESFSSVPESQYNRVLLYSINMDDHLSEKIQNRKFYPIYEMLYYKSTNKRESLPFDQILLFLYTSNDAKFTLIYDKDEKINMGRIKALMNKVQSTDAFVVDQDEIETRSQTAAQADVAPIKDTADITKTAKVVNTYLNTVTDSERDPETLTAKSAIFQNVGDKDKTSAILSILSSKGRDVRKTAIKKYTEDALYKEKMVSTATNEFINWANPSALVDDINPKHILELRKREFAENLPKDIENIFRGLSEEVLPLKFKSIVIKAGVHDPVGQLEDTIKDVYKIELEDDNKNIHKVEINLPHMNPDGTFILNGLDKILVSQLVSYPIYFWKPYSGGFSSAYTKFTVTSKQLGKGSYLTIMIMGYKIPIVMLLGYKLGLEGAFDLFGIKDYSITSTKTDNTYFKIGNGKFLNFRGTLSNTQAEFIESIKRSSKFFPPEFTDNEFKTSKFWESVLIKATGNRNCIYKLDKAWKLAVTPIETEILQSRGDPTEISRIIRYLAEYASNGRVDDRNDLSRLRVRLSELFSSLIQKQANAAYSEYESKREGGDDDAKYFIDANKVFSQFQQSQNLQPFESINPLEELSMLTRVTPIGIGGITDTRAFPKSARNIHHTYYGNIDPLESPEGGSIGIQQHLAMGASIGNIRGTFTIKDRDKVKPSEILSTTISMIPFVNMNEGARINMASGQAKQAFPLKYLEGPAVQSGYESLLTPLLSNKFIRKSPVQGKVFEMTDKLISIESISGSLHHVDITPAILRSGQGKNGLSIFKPIVKVGDKVKTGDIIAEGANIQDGVISNGLNMLVAFMPWKGYNFEDGMVISESAAKRFVSLHIEEYNAYLAEDDDVASIANEGDELDKGGILISFSKTVEDVKSFTNKRCEGGIVTKIEIYNNLPDDEPIPEKLQPIYKQFVRNYKLLHGKYPKGTFKSQKLKFPGILVKFTVHQELTLEKGDKLNNRFFNKGVVAIIEKDEDMPMTPWGDRIDMIYNPLSIINRMNPGQLAEMSVGLISRTLSIEMGKQTRASFTNVYSKVMNLLDNSENKIYSKKMVLKIKSISDKDYDKLKIKTVESKFIPIIVPPFKGPSSDNIAAALSMLGLKSSYPLRLDTYGITTKPVGVGYIYVLKLEHISSKKIHARGLGGYASKTLAPTQGKKVGGGQKLGEYDAFSLLSWDVPNLIDEFFGPLSNDHITKTQMISEVIQTGSAEHRAAVDNPTRDMFVQFMTSLHLESE